MERELEWLVGKLQEMPAAQRELRFPGYASPESMRSYLLALREQSPEAYRQFVDRMRTTGRPTDAPERWFPPYPDSPHTAPSHPNSPHPDSPYPNSPRPDSPHPNSPRPDSPYTDSDIPGSDIPGSDSARSDSARSNIPGSNSPDSDSPADADPYGTDPDARSNSLFSAPLSSASNSTDARAADARATDARAADTHATNPLAVDARAAADFLIGDIRSERAGQAPAPLDALRHDHPHPAPPAAPAPAGVDAPAPAPLADHVDFRDATFHADVIGVQHRHYPVVPMPTPVQWSPVDEVDPVEFGVQPTRLVPGLPEVPPYVPRDCDGQLRDLLLEGGGLVVVLGERSVGKSYTAWNAVRSLAEQGYLLYAPDPHEDLRALPTGPKGDAGKRVLWLDELGDHLGGRSGLDRRLLGRFAHRGVVVLGTMEPEEYYRRRSGTGPGESVLTRARTVPLAREWSESELARLAGHTDDPRAYPAYMWSGREGAASYFAIGHLLFDEWQRAGTQAEHPRGRLLVRVAVDLARCGVTEAVSVELLLRAAGCYPAEGVEREPLEAALAWATAPMFGISGLLVEGETSGTWRAYGALVAEALRAGDLPPVPDGVWWTLLGDREVDRAAVLDAAKAALRARVEGGDVPVMMRFASLTEGEEREGWYRRAADLGHDRAALRLATLLLRRGEDGEAIPYLEVAARRGVVEAARQLAVIYEVRARYWRDRSLAHPSPPDTVGE
ncbi:hypothetical protein [Streptomyces sp. NPDC001508]|uniref:hypothetical protein n=1 Tax=Streptomyces sp. NPDC001508 TaxID=3154656 RepID=UPI00331CC3F7